MVQSQVPEMEVGTTR